MLLFAADRPISGVYQRTNRVDELVPVEMAAPAKELVRDLDAWTGSQSDDAPVGEQIEAEQVLGRRSKPDHLALRAHVQDDNGRVRGKGARPGAIAYTREVGLHRAGAGENAVSGILEPRTEHLALVRIGFDHEHRFGQFDHGANSAAAGASTLGPLVPASEGRSPLRTRRGCADPRCMFIRYFLEVEDPYDRVEAALLSDPGTWIPGEARAADNAGEQLLSDVGFAVTNGHRVDKRVEISFGQPVCAFGQARLPLSWSATGPARLFPSFEADLEIAALGPARTQISISGRYRPPMGSVGRVFDRALLHRVAEATVKDFLDRVGERVSGRVHATACS